MLKMDVCCIIIAYDAYVSIIYYNRFLTSGALVVQLGTRVTDAKHYINDGWWKQLS